MMRVKLTALLPKLIIGIILLCGAVLRIPELNAPVSYDEAYSYIAFVRQPWLGLVSDYSLPNNHILYNLLAKISVSIFDSNPWSLRLPAFLAGMAAIPMAYYLGKSVFNPSIGLSAAALIAGLPAIIHYDIAARGYSLVNFFTLLAWFLGIVALDTGRLRAWLALTLTAALGIFTIPTMALPVGGIYLWLLGDAFFRKQAKKQFFVRWLGSGILALMLSAALYLPVLLVSGWRKLLANGFIAPVEEHIYFSRILWRQIVDVWDFWNRDTPLEFSLLLVLGIFLSLVFSFRNENYRLHLAIPMILWLGLYVILRRPNLYDRFLSFLLSPAMLWAAAGLLTPFQKIRWKNLHATYLLSATSVLVLVWVSGASLPSVSERWNKMSNVEALAIALSPELQPDDMVLAGSPFGPPLWYYLSRLGINDEAWQARNEFQRAFIVLSRRENQDISQIIQEYKLDVALFDLENAIKQGQIGNIEIYRLNPASP